MGGEHLCRCGLAVTARDRRVGHESFRLRPLRLHAVGMALMFVRTR